MSITDFTYESYRGLIKIIQESGYQFADYHNNEGLERPCILRHDVDNDLHAALRIAQIESELGITSTFFVLLRTDFYNVFSGSSGLQLHEIMSMGHEVGLHFDECAIEYSDVKAAIIDEMQILSKVTDAPVTCVSMHRPSEQTLNADMQITGIENSYCRKYFSEYKYLSDSRMNWREDVERIVSERLYDKLQILTHAFWYSEKQESMKEKILRFLSRAKLDRYHSCFENFRDLNSVITLEDLDEIES